MFALENAHIAVIGLGYVGLPLAMEFGKHYPVAAFDINEQRIAELKDGWDRTREVAPAQFAGSTGVLFTSEVQDLKKCNVYIVTVPSPIDEHRRPDFAPLLAASETIGKVLKGNDIVIYESTVYPGATEEECVPVLERASGLCFNNDFYVGYSPERINPGDKGRTLVSITKVTSGSTPEVAEFVNALYSSIVTAGTHLVSSIKVAEAAKVLRIRSVISISL